MTAFRIKAAIVVAVALALALAQRWSALAPASLWFDDVWVGALVRRAGLGEWWRLAPPVPLGFLALEWAAAAACGWTELAFQLVPLIAGLALIPLAGLAVCLLPLPREKTAAALLAMLLAAASPPLATYAARAKQYTLDALVVTLLAALLAWWGRERSRRALAAIATVAVAGLCVSFTAVFAGGAALGALILMALTARAKARDALLAGALYSGAFGILAFLLFRRQINPQVTTFWRAHLLPLADNDIVSFYLDNGATAFVRAFPMQLKELAYVVPLGLFMLLRHANTRPLGLYVATLYGGALTLAALGLYPLGKVRTDIYLYPCHFLCVAAGVMLIARGRFKGLAWIFAAGTASTLIALVFNRPVRYPDRGAGRLVAVTERARRPDEPLWLERSSTYFWALYGKTPVQLRPDAGSAAHFRVELADPRIGELPETNDPATLAGWLRTRARASQSVSAMFAALFVPSARTETVDAALESAGLVASESWARPGENRVVRLRLPVDSESHDP